MQNNKHIWVGLFILISILFNLQSCKEDSVLNSSNVDFRMSIDTLVFDTVFTTKGSITKRVKVINNEDEKIVLSQVRIANNVNQEFKINVDGVFKPVVSGIEIYPKDSIFIFLEVTIDPNNTGSPMIIEDDLIAVSNDTERKVHLVAWGQDAHYYYKETADTFLLTNGDTALLSQVRISSDLTLSNDKPHVFYSNIVVRNGATLSIDPGTRIHLAHNASVFVHDGGKLQINGSGFEDNRVIISGSRLDPDYKFRPGQWGVIRICQDAGESWIKNAEIKNGTIGCYLGGPFYTDLFNPNLTPKVDIENSIITNMNQYGVLLQSGEANISNSEISDCGELALFGYIGGKYKVEQSTIANYFSGRSTVSMALTNHVTNDNGENNFEKPLEFTMTNSIVYGNYQTELVLDKKDGVGFDVNFNTSLLRIEEGKDIDLEDASLFTDCIFNEDPEFIKTYDDRQSNYQLDTLSAAQNKANQSFSGLYPLDLTGKSRLIDAQSDIGAYERVD